LRVFITASETALTAKIEKITVILCLAKIVRMFILCLFKII